VLAADTRASVIFFIADVYVMKIQKFDRHMGVTIARGVDQNLADIMRYNANIYRISNKEPIPVKAATSLCSNGFTNDFPYFVQIILAGYDAQ